MNFDEQKLKRPDNIRLNDNQYENVNRSHSFKNSKRAVFTALFFARHKNLQ